MEMEETFTEKFNNVYFSGAINISNLVCSILSVFGSVYMFISIFRIKHLNISHKMMFFIAFGDLIYSFANLLTPWGEYNSDTICPISGPLNIFGVYNSVLFSLGIAYLSYQLSRDTEDFSLRYYRWPSFVLAELLCIVVGFIFPYFGVFGAEFSYNNFICLVSSKDGSNFAVTIYYTIPFAIGFPGFVLLYYLQYRNIKKMDPMILKVYGIDARRLFLYPVGMAIAFLPEMIGDILYVYFGIQNYYINLAHFISGHSLGLINAIVYGYLRNKRKNDKENIDEYI